MRRRRWDPNTKAEIVLQGIKGTPVSLLCEHYGICPSQYYKWQERLTSNLPRLFEDGRKTRAEAELRSENARLKQLVAELTLALKDYPDREPQR
ncbi:MAG: transposase [Proteobacteria bacterium]|nr:transposase [Pseudomonadota bacterium]